MIVYNPYGLPLLRDRLTLAEKILRKLPVKHCFITGSFLYSQKFKDIDVFVVTRSKKHIRMFDSVTLTKIDFNDLHSFFYHSVSKSCAAKNILPRNQLKVTITDYWSVVN